MIGRNQHNHQHDFERHLAGVRCPTPSGWRETNTDGITKGNSVMPAVKMTQAQSGSEQEIHE